MKVTYEPTGIDNFHNRRSIDLIIDKVKNQPPDLTAGEFNRGE